MALMAAAQQVIVRQAAQQQLAAHCAIMEQADLSASSRQQGALSDAAAVQQALRLHQAEVADVFSPPAPATADCAHLLQPVQSKYEYTLGPTHHIPLPVLAVRLEDSQRLDDSRRHLHHDNDKNDSKQDHHNRPRKSCKRSLVAP